MSDEMFSEPYVDVDEWRDVPVPDSEDRAQGATGEKDSIGFSVANGGYFLDGAGGLVSREWDFDGPGLFLVRDPFEGEDQLVVERQHAFRAAGTYFVTVRAAAHRDGDTPTPYARIHNLARVRVVVGQS